MLAGTGQGINNINVVVLVVYLTILKLLTGQYVHSCFPDIYIYIL